MIGRFYLKNLWLSLSTPQYYIKILREPLRQSVFFLIISCIWLGLLNGVFFIERTLPEWQKVVDQTANELQTNYPADLQLSWNQQQLTVTPAQVVSVSYPSALPIDKTVMPATLAIISPTEIMPSQFNQLPSSSLAVITPTKLYVSDQHSWNNTPLSQVPGFDQPFTVTKEKLPGLIATGKEYVAELFASLKWFGLLVSPLLLVLSAFWSCLINALLVYFILRVSGVYLKFLTVVKISAHVVVAALIVEQLQQWLYPTLSIPLFNLCYWAYMVLIIFVIRRQAELNRLKQMVREK